MKESSDGVAQAQARTLAPAPRATILFLAYEQASFVEAAARSVLAQVGEPLEILLSDDHSTDGTFEILERLAQAYSGPHQVRARRNPSNLGIGAHYNVLVAEARGQLLITAAGDDISLSHRAAQLLTAWDAHAQRPDLLASHLIDMTHGGELGNVIQVDDLADWPDVDAWARQRPYVVGAGHAFTRRLWDRFGPLAPEVVYEDQVITLRALLMGGGITVPEPLVQYRRGGASATQTFDSTKAFLSKVAQANRRAKTEQAQQMADALAAGRAEIVQAGLNLYSQRTALIAALLAQQSLLSSFRAMMAAPDLGWAWRWRKWLYLRYPTVGTAVRRWQYQTKQRRQGP